MGIVIRSKIRTAFSQIWWSSLGFAKNSLDIAGKSAPLMLANISARDSMSLKAATYNPVSSFPRKKKISTESIRKYIQTKRIAKHKYFDSLKTFLARDPSIFAKNFPL